VTVNSILPGPTRSAGLEGFVTQLGGGQSFEAFEKEFFRSNSSKLVAQNALRRLMESLAW